MSSRRAGKLQERLDVWPGFTDVMVGLLLVFVLVATLFTITETILSQSLSEKDEELRRLSDEISQKTKEMEALHQLISRKTVEMERLHRELSQQTEEMRRLQNEISLKTADLERLKLEVTRLEKLFQAQLEKTTGLEQLLAQRKEDLLTATEEIKKKTAALAESEQLVAKLRGERDTALARVDETTARIKEQEKKAAEQRERIASALTEIGEKTELLREREKRVSELGLKIAEAETALSKAKAELAEKQARVGDLGATIQALNTKIESLNKKIAGYIDEINRLNRLVSEARESETSQKTRAASLQKEIVALTGKLNEISKKLVKAKAEKKKKFRLTQLVNLLGRKDKEIDRLRKLARYRSEFLAKLEKVFSGIPDIQVQGDRFVFQSEILFASGRANINESGKKELDKFIRIYKEMVPKIPKDLPLLILVQGHTDTDPVRPSRYRSNWELSSERAMEVVRYMIDKGIPATRLGASALGEFHPVAKGTTRKAKRLNRRIEIKITML